MKNYVCAILCSLVLFLFSCNGQESTSNKNSILLNDSLAAESRAIDAFDKSVFACRDSINKYKMEAVNDSCLKYISVIYGAKRLKKYNSLTIDECSIKLTDFKRIANSLYSLRYSVFIKDSIPIIADLSEGAMIHTFEYNKITNEITKAYLGQHDSYLDETELKKLYHSSFVSNKNETKATQ